MTNDELEARLAKARARKEAAETKRERTQAERTPLEEVERAELEAANAEAIAAAEEEHGPIGEAIGTVECRGGVVILRRPVHAFFRAISREIGSKNEQKSEAAANRLIEHCRVYPSHEALEKLTETYPLLPGALIAMIVKLAAGGASVTGE